MALGLFMRGKKKKKTIMEKTIAEKRLRHAHSEVELMSQWLFSFLPPSQNKQPRAKILGIFFLFVFSSVK